MQLHVSFFAAVAGGLLLALAGSSAADTRIRAEFDVRHAGVKVGEVRWEIDIADGGRVRFASDNRTTGAARLFRDVHIEALSEGRLTDADYITDRYRFERRGDRRANRVLARFDHAAGRLTLTSHGETTTQALPAGLVDELGHLLALARRLARGERSPRLRVLRRDQVREYVYAFDGAAAVDSALGRYETLRVRRVRAGGDRATTVWSAPALRYLPLRISHREQDRRIEIRLVSWSLHE